MNGTLPSLHAKLSGHELMTLFPPKQLPPQDSNPRFFGKEEREYLSSSRDESRLRRQTAVMSGMPAHSNATSSGSSGASTSSSPSPTHRSAPAPTRSSSSSAPRDDNLRPSKPASTQPQKSAPRMQVQTIAQGAGDQQFSILRMPLESFSNHTETTSQFSEFRTRKASPSAAGSSATMQHSTSTDHRSSNKYASQTGKSR